jgi:hypothetical protein
MYPQLLNGYCDKYSTSSAFPGGGMVGGRKLFSWKLSKSLGKAFKVVKP